MGFRLCHTRFSPMNDVTNTYPTNLKPTTAK